MNHGIVYSIVHAFDGAVDPAFYLIKGELGIKRNDDIEYEIGVRRPGYDPEIMQRELI